jgi:hypothetical protein
MRKKTPKKASVAPRAVVAPVPTPVSPVPKETLLRATQEATEAVLALASEYGAPEAIPVHVQARLNAISLAMDLQAVAICAAKAEQTMFIHLLAQWARNRIPGKLNERTVESRIKKALNLADMLEARGLTEAAESQRVRAEAIKAEWETHQTIEGQAP